MGTASGTVTPDILSDSEAANLGASQSAPMTDQDAAGFGAPSQNAPQDNGGIGRNLRAGFEEGLTSIPGMVVNAINPVPHVEELLHPFGGYDPKQEASDLTQAGSWVSHKLNQGLGLIGLNPEDVGASSPAERIVRMAGAGLTAALAPEAAPEELAEAVAPRLASRLANAPIETVAKKALTGAAAGIGGGAAGEAVPDTNPVPKQAAEVLGSIAGGAITQVPGLLSAGARGVARWAAPMTEQGQRQAAADTLRTRATNPAELDQNIQTGANELVPGSQPTTFQATGDMGLGSLEREQAAKNPAAFQQRRADQNAARQAALSSMQAGGDPSAVGSFLRGQFRNFDDQTQQHIDALTANAQQAAEALGGSGNPEQHGAAIRSALQDAENGARARERSLWRAVDPDNAIRVDATPTFDAARDIRDGMSRFAAPMTGEEQGIHQSILDATDLTGAPRLSLGELSDLRSRVSTAARAELTQNGNSPAYARLIRLRGAIQNNLADAATNQAQRDAEAVASGTMAPQETLSNKIQGWVNDFYGNRASRTGETGGEGIGAGPAGGPASNGSPSGAAFSPIGGLGGAPGPEGIPPEPRPITEADAANLAAATAATKQRAATFGAPGPIKQTLAKQGTQDAYRLPEARVPEKFFHAGPTSFQDVQGLRQAVGDQAALPILRDYAAASLRRAAENPDGTLDPRKVAAWQRRFAGPLRAFPELQDQFSSAANATQAIADSVAARRQAIADRDSSVLGRIAGANNAEDTTNMVGSIFGKRDAVQQMQDLANAASRSPEAQQGLRRAVADYITKNLISNTEAGTSGQSLIKSDSFQTFLKKNRDVLAAAMTPEQMSTLDNIAADLRRANRSTTAVKLPGGSNTAQDIHGIIANNPNLSIMDKILGSAAATAFGHAVAGAGGTVLGFLGANAAMAARQAGLAKADQIVTEALLNPKFAQDLLRSTPPRAAVSSGDALAMRLRRMGMGVLATKLGGSGRQRNYAEGGKVRQRPEDITPEEAESRMLPPRYRKHGGRVNKEAKKADSAPSQAQIESGDYKKGHVRIHGLELSIETPKGVARRGVGRDGKPWENVHPTAHYGYLKRTVGADGEHVDAYLGPHHESDRVYVFDQHHPHNGRFDEHKVVLGARAIKEAKKVYDDGFSDGSGPRRRRNVRQMTVGQFKHWLEHGDTTAPVAKAA